MHTFVQRMISTLSVAIAGPLHTPAVIETDTPTCALFAEIVGSVFHRGGAITTTWARDTADTEPSELVAVTTATSPWPTSAATGV